MDWPEIIKKEIKEILSRLTIEADVEPVETSDGFQFIIKTREGGILIGENGKNLLALSHLLKRIIQKTAADNKAESPVFSLDVNDYQAKKIEDLKNLARLNAQRVRYFKKEIILRPMTSFERRIIHAVLSDCPDIITSSQGEEPQRQVVIKPYL